MAVYAADVYASGAAGSDHMQRTRRDGPEPKYLKTHSSAVFCNAVKMASSIGPDKQFKLKGGFIDPKQRAMCTIRMCVCVGGG